MMIMQTNMQIEQNILHVRESMAAAAAKAGVRMEDITLVAASKMNDANRVREAIAAGVDATGENRVQELLEKYEAGAYRGKPLHFIGTLQTNKVKYLVGKVDLIESVGSIKLASVIAKEAAKQGICQDILLEINIGKEPAKSGLMPDEIWNTLENLAQEPAIRVCGLMAIPPIATAISKNIRYFDEMHQLFVDISTKKYDNMSMRFLSMGMSNDYADAIACGSNMIRVGSAIFGTRNYERTQY